jgi:membrane-bound serine protease (ClpP class)
MLRTAIFLLKRYLIVAAMVLAFGASQTLAQNKSTATDAIFIIDIKGAIGIAATRQITQALDKARTENAAALVIRLDTPGGLVSATRDIIQAMLAAPLPVIVYVAPSGARAASAGTFIVYAAHVAAMAPGTNLGAATPIEIGLPGLPQPTRPGQDAKDKSESKSETAAQRKAINDTVAMLRSLAQLRGRNADWAEKAVREAATLTADDALKEGVIDIVAQDLNDLLARATGRIVTVGGVETKLAIASARREFIEPDWRTRLLAAISDPNVAFILLLVGVYGILLEFWNPGGLIPGVIGGISLLLALTALSALPIQYGALGLIVLGVGLMAAEAFVPGFGILGIGGIVAFIVGALFLFDPAGADIDIAIATPLIIGAAATSALLTFFVLGAAIQARYRPPVSGAEEMIGAVGKVIEWQELTGSIRIHGEVWGARSDRTFNPGETVRVAKREGLALVVEAAS